MTFTLLKGHDPGLYEDSEFFDDPGKTQELIN